MLDFRIFLGSNYLRYTPGGQKQLEKYLQQTEHRCLLPMFFFSLSWRRLLNLSWRRLGAPVLETLQEIILNRSQHTPLELNPTACQTFTFLMRSNNLRNTPAMLAKNQLTDPLPAVSPNTIQENRGAKQSKQHADYTV